MYISTLDLILASLENVFSMLLSTPVDEIIKMYREDSSFRDEVKQEIFV